MGKRSRYTYVVSRGEDTVLLPSQFYSMTKQRDPYDGEYIGNIFGWRFSLIGAAVILGLVAFAAYRHYSLGVPIGFEDQMELESERYAPATSRDTLRQ